MYAATDTVCCTYCISFVFPSVPALVIQCLHSVLMFRHSQHLVEVGEQQDDKMTFFMFNKNKIFLNLNQRSFLA